jgi:hypothetical protein
VRGRRGEDADADASPSHPLTLSPPLPLSPYTPGGGRVERDGPVQRLAVGPVVRGYADAQLDDYAGLRRGRFRWCAPARLRVRARLSAGARGTAGFGFWNNPFGPQAGWPALPDAVWFFYASPPNAMELVPGVPGDGWKAAVVHAARPGAPAWGLPVVAALAWARLTGRTARAGRWLQRLTGAHEAVLAADPADWHAYEIDWGRDAAVFCVDGAEVLRAPGPPRGPLGLVIWIDNQYAVVTPRGVLGGGIVALESEQWLELEELTVA